MIKTLSTEIVWKNRWYALRRDAIQLPDGSQGEYTVVERPQAVFIVPYTHDGRLTLIKHYRYTFREWLWEVPAGSVEEGDSLEEAAARELKEEVGGTATHLESVGSFCTMPGISDERSHVYLAHGVDYGTPNREVTEIMETHHLDPHTVYEMLNAGVIQDGPSALALWMCKARIVGC